ncbi:MAG: peptidylprolyl isomerase [Treponemataceae bacterium]|nr:peptidylprolyl isomerase [Treponemataceae bacterium]
MNISKDKVVAIAYTLKNTDGEILDSSEQGNPLVFIQGNGHLIPGLENALEGKAEGEELSVTVEPKDAYGEYDEKLVFEVDKTQFPENVDVKAGMNFEAENGQIVTVKEVGESKVKIDANHPMAGQTLCFDVKIESVRDLTDEEMAMMKGGCGGGCGGCGGGSCGESCGPDCSCGGCGGGCGED